MKGAKVHVSTVVILYMQYKGVVVFINFVNSEYSLSQDHSTQLFFVGQILAELLQQL